MSSKAFVSSLPKGSALYVIAHAAWQRSRGRRPSMSFLTERNPRKALASAFLFLKTHKWEATLDSLATKVGAAIGQRKNYREMSEQELKIVVRGIVSSSSSKEEILRRLLEEVGCPEGDVMIDVSDVPTDTVGIEARELVRALGGHVTQHGAMVHIEICAGMSEMQDFLGEEFRDVDNFLDDGNATNPLQPLHRRSPKMPSSSDGQG